MKLAWAALAAAGCSSSASTLSLSITTGLETDAFSADPPVTTVTITATDVTSGEVLTASTTPDGDFDLGDATSTDAFVFDVAGVTDAGAEVVGGRSLAIVPASVEGQVLPVFAERVNGWSRPPGALARAHVGGAATILSERYLMLAGGTESVDPSGGTDDVADPELYDLGTLGALVAGDKLPRAPETLIGLGDFALLIDGSGASWLSVVDGSTGDATPPDGLAFADVAGGREVDGPDGTVYVVGAARAGAPTTAVLAIATDGTLSSFTLAAARAGAAAAYVDGVGLVVAGGSATAAGVEVLSEGANLFMTRAFPADATTGAALASTSFGTVLLGGVDPSSGEAAPARQLDATCASDCATTALGGIALDAPLSRAQAYLLDGNRALVVGDELDAHGGEAPPPSRAYLVDLSAMTASALPLREPRRGATFVPAPNGTLAVLGGVHEDQSAAVHVEMLFPQ